jgi:hypothetical protein
MRKTSFALAALLGAGFAASLSTVSAAEGVGYKDTPMLPGQPWHVHDPDRPVPHLVTPGETFSHGAPPPSDAVVLFDGKDLSKWKSDKGPAGWKVENGYMEVVKEAGSIFTKDEFGDFQLHLEFATPAKVEGNSQGRGNSGVYIYGRYEVQVLDSYNNPTYPDGEVGAIYGQYPPLATAPKKPGEWQSYDIICKSPRWDENKKLTKPASVTVILNGVVLHNRKELIGSTMHREVGTYKPHPPHGPILLQDHGNPTRFRNIWIRNLGEYDKP